MLETTVGVAERGKREAEAKILEVSTTFEAIISKLNKKLSDVNSAAQSATVATTLKNEFPHSQIKLGKISDMYNASKDRFKLILFQWRI